MNLKASSRFGLLLIIIINLPPQAIPRCTDKAQSSANVHSYSHNGRFRLIRSINHFTIF
ncbi:unnamed protein product [Clavelina lepadiformis]|uniref:Secreted protein n=1 Tax=Clavelina lepadiformis TaxID=159417 RepID=A0ABP0FME0_CLALP